MELGTFGAIVGFALELESSLNEFYENAINISKESVMRNVYKKLLKRGLKRVKNLKRIRRENTTEMILEPITGLESDNYAIEITLADDSDDATILNVAGNAHQQIKEFYMFSSTKITFLMEAADAFERLAENHDVDYQLLKR